MQYILTEEEMTALRRNHRLASEEELVNVCRHVAETMIQTAEVNGECFPEGRPHRCIHVRHRDGTEARYCDGCQVAGICPQPKEWSK